MVSQRVGQRAHILIAKEQHSLLNTESHSKKPHWKESSRSSVLCNGQQLKGLNQGPAHVCHKGPESKHSRLREPSGPQPFLGELPCAVTCMTRGDRAPGSFCLWTWTPEFQTIVDLPQNTLLLSLRPFQTIETVLSLRRIWTHMAKHSLPGLPFGCLGAEMYSPFTSHSAACKSDHWGDAAATWTIFTMRCHMRKPESQRVLTLC